MSTEIFSYGKRVAIVTGGTGSIGRSIVDSFLKAGLRVAVLGKSIEALSELLTQQRIGFLHQRAYYKIPQQPGFILIFDVNSGFLMVLFLVSSATIVALIIYFLNGRV